MAALILERPEPQIQDRGPSASDGWSKNLPADTVNRPYWKDPLLISLVGAPLWWILGLFQAMFFITAAIMLLAMARRREAVLPRFFLVWVLFLLWAIGGLFTLQADAPGAVPGDNAGRYVTWSYRYAWYASAAVVLLYVMNSKQFLSSNRIAAALSWFFVVLVGGGLVGLIFPNADFPSLLEFILPRQISQIPLAQDLIHPSTAQVQSVLGDPEARPSAPFAFTNEWGMNMALCGPFFVYHMWRKGVLARIAMGVVLCVAIIPIVDSLNRGLWIALVVAAVFTALRSASLGNLRSIATIGVLGVVALAILVGTPLGATVQARIDTPHSDEGRANLSAQTVSSTLAGSPVIGYGSTRDVAGNFNSIAGGSSDACPGCTPPPMGTHGQAWQLIFTTGFGGFLLYITFLGLYFARHLRSRAAVATPALTALVTAFFTMPIYNATGVSLIVIFAAIGLLARLDSPDQLWSRPSTIKSAIKATRSGVGLLLAGLLIGGLGGLLVHVARGQTVEASQSVLVPPLDMLGETGVRDLTLDSEAELAIAANAASPAVGSVDSSVGDLQVTAKPNTRVLTLSYKSTDDVAAEQAVTDAVQNFLQARSQLHQATEESLETRFQDQYLLLSNAHNQLDGLLEGTAGDSARGVARLEEFRIEMTAVAGRLEKLNAKPDLGGAISAVQVKTTSDDIAVRVGSGIVLGIVVGLVAAFLRGARQARARQTTPSQTVLGLRTTTVSGARTAEDQSRSLRPFLPLGGLVADPTAVNAVRLADSLEPYTASPDSLSPRVLLVANNKSTLSAIGQMIQQCEALRLEPVGLLVVSSPRESSS